jgi:hypothetical protein
MIVLASAAEQGKDPDDDEVARAFMDMPDSPLAIGRTKSGGQVVRIAGRSAGDGKTSRARLVGTVGKGGLARHVEVVTAEGTTVRVPVADLNAASGSSTPTPTAAILPAPDAAIIPPPAPRNPRAARSKVPRLNASTLKLAADGSLHWATGETVSTAGVVLRWEAEFDARDDSKVSVYKLVNTLDLDDLVATDEIGLPVRGLRISRAVGDDTTIGTEQSAFHRVKIQSVRRDGARVHVAVMGRIPLASGAEITEIEYVVQGESLVHP